MKLELIKEMKSLLEISFDYEIFISEGYNGYTIRFHVLRDKTKEKYSEKYAFGEYVEITTNDTFEKVVFHALGGGGAFEPFNLNLNNYERLCGLRLQAKVIDNLHDLMGILIKKHYEK